MQIFTWFAKNNCQDPGRISKKFLTKETKKIDLWRALETLIFRTKNQCWLFWIQNNNLLLIIQLFRCNSLICPCLGRWIFSFSPHCEKSKEWKFCRGQNVRKTQISLSYIWKNQSCSREYQRWIERRISIQRWYVSHALKQLWSALICPVTFKVSKTGKLYQFD